MFEKIAEDFLRESAAAFENYKKLAEKAFGQVSDEEFFRAIDVEANSIAALAKHLGGNLRSRWTDFLTTDGEKPDRNRDSEFVTGGDARQSLMQFWEEGWRALFAALESLRAEDLSRTVKIRGEDYTVVKATNRALAHAAYHIGQIVLLAKHFRSREWQSLSIPKNRSADFNAYLAENKTGAHYLEAPREFAEKRENKKGGREE
jgi:hypothetical protein